MLKNLLLPILLILALGCQPDDRSAQGDYGADSDESVNIVGGKVVEENSRLGQLVLELVSVYYVQESFGQSPLITREQCTAVALSRSVVLTAAHCWKDIPGASHSVRVFDESGESPEFRVIGKVIPDKFYLGNFDYDLALLQLEKPLPASVELAILPKYINEVHPAAVIVSGYGKSQGRMSGFEGIGELRGAALSVLDYKKYPRTFVVDQRQGRGICQGDSGGPAFALQGKKWILVGVASRTSGLENSDNIHRDICNKYGYFVKVDRHLNWINTNLKILNRGHMIKRSLIEKTVLRYRELEKQFNN